MREHWKTLFACGIVIAAAGVTCVVRGDGWWDAAGITLMLWANNIGELIRVDVRPAGRGEGE